MRIVSLSAENVKRLKVVEITPKGDVVQITGKNASGKSSVLDSIMYALGGTKDIPGEPIRKGCDRARIKLNLGTVVVERKFTPSGTTISVTNEEGATYKSPQKMLDDLLGALTFDPLKFSRLKPREQFDELRKLVKLPIDIDALNAANQTDYDKRTDINRQAKQFMAQANAILVDQNTPVEPVDESALLDGIEEAGKFNADIQRRQANREKAVKDVADLRTKSVVAREAAVNSANEASERIAELQLQIDSLKSRSQRDAVAAEESAKSHESAAHALEAKLSSAPPLPSPISITELRASLDAAKRTNQQVAERKRREDLLEQARMSEAAALSLTEAMDAREKQKQDAVKAADMPVAGLGFGADFVSHNGVPFDQASSAEQLRVSCGIAMAANPKLRVIRIQDGSLLDPDGLKLIAEMAAEKDFQVWMESCDVSGKIGVFMEDGAVKAVDGEAV